MVAFNTAIKNQNIITASGSCGKQEEFSEETSDWWNSSQREQRNGHQPA